MTKQLTQGYNNSGSSANPLPPLQSPIFELPAPSPGKNREPFYWSIKLTQDRSPEDSRTNKPSGPLVQTLQHCLSSGQRGHL